MNRSPPPCSAKWFEALFKAKALSNSQAKMLEKWTLQFSFRANTKVPGTIFRAFQYEELKPFADSYNLSVLVLDVCSNFELLYRYPKDQAHSRLPVILLQHRRNDKKHITFVHNYQLFQLKVESCRLCHHVHVKRGPLLPGCHRHKDSSCKWCFSLTTESGTLPNALLSPVCGTDQKSSVSYDKTKPPCEPHLTCRGCSRHLIVPRECFLRHEKLCLKKRIIYCDLCNVFFNGGLKEHRLKCKTGKFKCRFCGELLPGFEQSAAHACRVTQARKPKKHETIGICNVLRHEEKIAEIDLAMEKKEHGVFETFSFTKSEAKCWGTLHSNYLVDTAARAIPHKPHKRRQDRVLVDLLSRDCTNDVTLRFAQYLLTIFHVSVVLFFTDYNSMVSTKGCFAVANTSPKQTCHKKSFYFAP